MINIDITNLFNYSKEKIWEDKTMVQNWDEKKKEKFEKWVIKKNRNVERMINYNESRVIDILVKTASYENWTYKKHVGSDTGVDLILQKDKRTIIIEAKGERETQINVKQPVENALGAIIMSMKDNSLEKEYCYCLAFPDTESFRKIVRSIPHNVLQALKLNMIFIECPKETIKFCKFSSSNDNVLIRFDQLFEG
jgi:hypothetical protein